MRSKKRRENREDNGSKEERSCNGGGSEESSQGKGKGKGACQSGPGETSGSLCKRQEEASCSNWQGAVRMEQRPRSGTPQSQPAGVGSWHILCDLGGRLLWRKCSDRREDSVPRDDSRGQPLGDQAIGNQPRGHLEGGNQGAGEGVQDPSLRTWVRDGRDRRLLDAWQERVQVDPRSGGALDAIPGRGQDSRKRRRRARRVEEKSRGIGGEDEEQRRRRRQDRRGEKEKEEEKGVQQRRGLGQEEKEEEKEEGEREEREADDKGGKSSDQGRSKDFRGGLWRDRPRPRQDGEEKSQPEGSKIPGQEEDKGVVRFPIGRFFKRQQRRWRKHSPWRVNIRGRDPGETGVREVPGMPCPRLLEKHAKGFVGNSRRRRRLQLNKAGGAALLPEHPEQEDLRASGQGDGQFGHQYRPLAQREDCPRAGCPPTTSKSPRSEQPGNCLDRSPEDRTGTSRCSVDDWQSRVESGPKGPIRRGQDKVVHRERPRRKEGRCKRKWKEQRKQGRPRERRKGKEQGRRPEQELKCRSKEEEKEKRIEEEESYRGEILPAGGPCLNLDVGNSVCGGSPAEPALRANAGEVFPSDQGPFEVPGHVQTCELQDDKVSIQTLRGPTKKSVEDLVGKGLLDVGPKMLQWLLEVIPLRSKHMGRKSGSTLFPLPTSSTCLASICPELSQEGLSWLASICLSLNSLWGQDLFHEGAITEAAREAVTLLSKDVVRLKELTGKIETFQWGDFFSTRGIDYKGDEVKTALQFTWSNIDPALPDEIGRVPLQEVCSQGARHYVENFDLFIRPLTDREPVRAPRVMVADEDWPQVCSGLVSKGLCVYMHVDELYSLGDRPLLNGMFGVTKDEWVGGTEIYRLIMNLVPLNAISYPLKGDVETLPMWAMMNPFFLQPSEQLVISSEDARCFFYTMSVPTCWYKYLGFNKAVPDSCLPHHLKGQEVYLASRVLPMGFLNSVSLAQHVHRNLALWSSTDADGNAVNLPEAEMRKDKPLTTSTPAWRIYLDNYDLLERVSALDVDGLRGTEAPSVLSLRQQYEVWDIPRNMKKSVSRQTHAEVQGAQVDGIQGIAYPRESKLLKYLGAALALLSEPKVTQREMQVVCGGLVYVSMFSRQLLGCLNAVWRFIESFNQAGAFARLMPEACRQEILRFLGLFPLARLDFRLPFHGQVTCSDASTSGGGVCASTSMSRFGSMVSQGSLRGDHPESRHDHKVLTIGLFDGIGALRVAADLLHLDLLGHISVEREPSAQRVVESHFPEVTLVKDVALVDDAMVAGWSRDYSQASLVILGSGPPCQGVSGLNANRKGALRDERSGLFTHVGRIRKLLQKHFCWCQVHSLMESVASMDPTDREVMSEGFGSQPWICDSSTISWCSRPRLYWITWELQEQSGVEFLDTGKGLQQVKLSALQDLEEVCSEGWIKVDPTRSFPTFTTSRPRANRGYKPAGLEQCNYEEITRWVQDQHRYPPYQYKDHNLLINSKQEKRLPNIQEKEYMMGFPINYTLASVSKSRRGSQEHLDIRHSLIGNSWSVPVVSWFLSQLCAPLGLCALLDPQQIVDRMNPHNQVFLQSRLWRQPLRPLRGNVEGDESILVRKLGNLVSIKGEDILLATPTSQLTKYHRLRASIPGKLWRWKIITGWSWTGSKEHINSLELRGVLTSLKWRLERQRHMGCRFLHLVDSLVVLHCLARGRSSSRKLRSTLTRINALLLCTSTQALWGYIHTDQNPADRPSRWGRKVKTKFRNA